MKTINYQLSSQKCLEEGWTVRPPSPLTADEGDDAFIPEPLNIDLIRSGRVRIGADIYCGLHVSVWVPWLHSFVSNCESIKNENTKLLLECRIVITAVWTYARSASRDFIRIYCTVLLTVYYFGGENENVYILVIFFSWDWWRSFMKMDRSSWLCSQMEQEIYCILFLTWIILSSSLLLKVLI